MRVCWNWQTGTFEGRVHKCVWVQVPLLAPNLLTRELKVKNEKLKLNVIILNGG